MARQDGIARWAEIFGALASEPRLQIVSLLARGEARCQEISQHFDLSQPAISYHLTKLERAGVLVKRREGTRHCYRISDELRPLFDRLMKENKTWNTQ